MLKKLEGHSFYGVVLFVSVLYLGLLFRYTGLESISSWGDEVASLYFAQHLDRVFFFESHTPFYYGLCRVWITIFPASVVSLRCMFIFISLFVISITTYLFYKKSHKKFVCLILFVLVWLWPTDIIYSRQARHYSLFLELTLLIIVLWQYRSDFKKAFLWIVWALFQLVHPFAIIPVLFLAIYDLLRKRSNLNELRFYFSTTLPLLVYYAVRFIFFGKVKVLSNIGWITNDSSTFLKSLILLSVGDSYPLTSVYPLSKVTSLLFLGIVSALFIILKKKGSLQAFDGLLKFVILFVITLGIVEAGSFFLTNLRIGRYFIFLVPFFLFGLFQLIQEISDRRALLLSAMLMVILGGYSIVIFKPWTNYVWDDQNVASFKEYYQSFPKRPFVVCANAFQLDYFFNRKYEDCSTAALRLHLARQDFYLFDLTGNDRMLELFLSNNAKLETFEKFNQAIFMSITYPPTKSL